MSAINSAMDDDTIQPPSARDTSHVLELARATRFALVCIVFGLSYFAIRASLNIPAFMRVFEDMLGSGSQLPALTISVFKARHVFVGISFAAPALCLGLLFVRNIPRAIRLIGVTALVVIAESIVLHNALTAPLTEIVTRMQSGAPM
jgi:hypothetical protein